MHGYRKVEDIVHALAMVKPGVSDKGLIDLAYRSGSVVSVSAHAVHENDEFEYELGLEEKLRHVPALKDRGNVILYYACWKGKDGGYGFAVMSVEDIKAFKNKYSKAANSSYSPWVTNFDSMAKKSVLKQALKYAPLKTEFVRAAAIDETIKSSIAQDMTDVNDETVYDAPYEEVVEQAPEADAEPVKE